MVIAQGLCKLGSAGGTDFSMKQFAEGSTLKLAKQCRKYVCLQAIPHWLEIKKCHVLSTISHDVIFREWFLEFEIRSKLSVCLLGGCVMSLCLQRPVGGPWKASPTSPSMRM